MRPHLRLIASICLSSATLHASGLAQSPYTSNKCPIPNTVSAYTVIVRPESGSPADTSYLRQLAEGIAASLTPPDAIRRPVAGAVISSTGALLRATLRTESGDRRFDARILNALKRAVSDTLLRPPSLGSPSDSLTLLISFGEVPQENDHAFARASMQSRAPTLLSSAGSFSAAYQHRPGGLSGYAVALVLFPGSGGRPQPYLGLGTEATDGRLVPEVARLIPELKYTPGQRDCSPRDYFGRVFFGFNEGQLLRLDLLK